MNIQSSRLVLALKAMTSQEHQQFQDFVSCALFNTRKQYIILTDLILQYAPDFRSSEMNEEKLYGVLSLKSLLTLRRSAP
jgi:hypothetical protein